MASVAILIPTMRAHNLANVVQTIADSTDDCRIVVIATGDCAEAARSLPVTLIDDGGGTWPQRINRGYRETTEPYIFTGADDLAFRPNWFQSALQTMGALPEGSGVVAINDTYNPAGTHFLISRGYIEQFGVIDNPGSVCCEDYVHAYTDDELRATAQFHGRYCFSREAVVEHLHWGAGKAPNDEVYSMGAASMPQGLATLQSRAHLWQK